MSENQVDRFVGVQVADEATYQLYRQHMLPILERYGGRFIVDVRVSEVLKSPRAEPFNRLFTIRFPDEAALNAFFSCDEYQRVRERFFEPSVAATAALAKYAVISG